MPKFSEALIFDVHRKSTREGYRINHFPLLFDQERVWRVHTHVHMWGVCMCCMYSAVCTGVLLDAQLCECVHLYTCVSGCMVCVLAVMGVCVYVVVSVHMLQHFRRPVMLTYTLVPAGPDRSAPEVCRGRWHFPPNARPCLVSASLFLSQWSYTLSSACLISSLQPNGRDWGGGLSSLPSCSLMPSLQPLTEVERLE